MRVLPLMLCCLPLAVSAAKPGGDKDKDAWSVESSLAAPRTVAFSTEEGTWMNLDVSPDGKRIVFDLLGDLYLLRTRCLARWQAHRVRSAR